MTTTDQKNIVDLLIRAKEKGITVFLEEEKLKIRVSRNAPGDEEMLGMLKSEKTRILAFLGRDDNPEEKAILPADRSAGPLPLSYAQERLWFIDRLQGSVQYHLPTVLRLKNKIDPGALERALRALLERHEVLRTRIAEQDGNPFQEVLPASGWKLDYITQGAIPQGEIAARIAELIEQPFDLSSDYMLRAHLIERSAEDFTLVLVLHHIATDGWSNSILVRDLTALYRAETDGKPAKLPKLPVQYADYAVWQRSPAQEAVMASGLDWWAEQLKNTEPLQLPLDFPRPAVQSVRGEGIILRLGKTLSDKLKALALETETTLFMTLAAAFKVLLYRYCGQDDICIGTPVANRRQREIEHLAGFFVNTLALRSDLGGNPEFRTLLRKVRENCIGAFERQSIPFEQIVDRVGAERSLSSNPLFQVMFILQNAPQSEGLKLGDLALEGESVERTTTLFDLIFSVNDSPAGLYVKMIYCKDLFRRATIERMGRHFNNLLENIAADPDQNIGYLNMLDPEERKLVLKVFNDNQTGFKGLHQDNVADLFERQVQATPHATALVCGMVSLDYRELNGKADQLAGLLRSQPGFHRGARIGVLMERSHWNVICMIGIFKAGAVYVPVDIAYPDHRIEYILKDSGQACCLINADEPLGLVKRSGIPFVDLRTGFETEYPDIADPEAALPLRDPGFLIYTSGSTGTPKGVEQTHLTLFNLVMWCLEQSGLTRGGKCLQYASFSFDMSLYETFFTLASGGELHICEEWMRKDLPAIKEYILTQEIEILSMPYSALKWLFEEFADGPTGSHRLRDIISAGEQLHITGGLRKFLVENPEVRLFNQYGPSETHVATGAVFSFSAGDPPMEAHIGRPVSNNRVYILDDRMQPVPVGIDGEIYIGGHHLAHGYRNDQRRTEARFIPDPFLPGERLYKTGDQARWMESGEISFRGRKDDQIKIRGFRVEIGEIQSVLNGCSLIKESAVIALKSNTGELRLHAYIVPEGEFGQEDLMVFLETRLPDFMIPERIICLPEIPLNGNGKVDRRALESLTPEQETQLPDARPQTDTQKTLAALWKELLGVEDPGLDQDFFRSGGHSLLAMRMVSGIRKHLRRELPVKVLFAHPTLRSLSRYLEEAKTPQETTPLTGGNRPERIPLSFSQERLWFIDQMSGSRPYHLPVIWRLSGEVDKRSLELALRQLIERHETFRTVIRTQNGIAYQEILPADDWRMGFHTGLSSEKRKALIAGLVDKPFDLTADYLLRADLLEAGPGDLTLVLVMHHIACDGWSNSILVRDFTALYEAILENRPHNLPSIPVHYADYAVWQRETSDLNAGLAWWENNLKGAESLDFPTDFPRPTIRSTRGATYGFMVSAQEVETLRRLGQDSGATLFMTLFAALNVLFRRYTGQADISIGTVAANRNRKEIEDVVGFFVNNLVLRNNLEGNPPFSDLLGKIRKSTLEAFERQEIPFDQVVDRLKVERSLSRSPLFEVMFILQNTPDVPRMSLGETSVGSESPGAVKAMFDMVFSATETPDGLHIGVVYCADLFEAETIRRICGHFRNLLCSIGNNPDAGIMALPMLEKAETALLNARLNPSPVQFNREQTVLANVDAWANGPADQVALVYRDKEWTYSALKNLSDRLALAVQARFDIHPGEIIGVMANRSDLPLIALLGAMKSGAAYLPLNPADPEERLKYIIGDTSLKGIIVDAGNSEKAENLGAKWFSIEEWLAGDQASEMQQPLSLPAPEDLAYVIYTSGSTGRPKGVLVEHGSLANTINSQQQAFGFDQGDRCLQFISYTFDASLLEIFTAWTAGAALHIAGEEERNDPAALMDLMSDEKITAAIFPAGYLGELEAEKIPSLRILVTGGESPRLDKIAGFSARGVQYFNSYGPTEAGIAATIYRHPGPQSPHAGRLPIGFPVDNMGACILDSAGGASPVGAVGELCLAGPGLARGYLNNPVQTQKAFALDAGGKRIYRTGDLCRWLPDGQIGFVGRRDDQVKIRGHRVELQEIEQVLNACPAVKTSVVKTQTAPDGRESLIAYVVPGHEFDQAEMEKWLRQSLPGYMVPTHWVALQSVPRTATGKIDKKALPAPDFSRVQRNGYFPPQNEIEHIIADVWEEVLQVDRVSRFDNFFEIGGHSLLAMRVVSALRQKLGREIKVADIFTQPALDGLAKLIRSGNFNAGLPEVILKPLPDPIPLSFAQERLWFIHRLNGSSEYHMPAVMHLSGEVDQNALARALKALVERHPALRTVIRETEGAPHQIILGSDDWEMGYSRLNPGQNPDGIIAEQVNRPFDLSVDYMLRAHLLEIEGSRFILILVVHHIASDGWSQSILTADLAALYEAECTGMPAVLPDLPLTYAHYAVWQRRQLESAEMEKQLSGWTENLKGIEPLVLPTDFPRPAVKTFKGNVWVFRMDKELAGNLQDLAVRKKASLFMVLLSALKVLLYRYTGQTDMAVGTPLANRGQKELEGIVGFFLNTLALRTDLSGNPGFIQVLEKVRQNVLTAFANQNTPFEQVVQAAWPRRSRSITPLFQVMMVMQNAGADDDLQLGDADISSLSPGFSRSLYDISFLVKDTAGNIQVAIEYATDLFREGTIKRMAEHFQNLLEAVVAAPEEKISRLNILGDAEENRLRIDFNETAMPFYPYNSVVELIDRQASLYPDQAAVAFGQNTMTYAALKALSDKLADYLTDELELAAEDLIGITGSRSDLTVVSILGILKAGCAYVPIDVNYPAGRKSYIISDTCLKALICTSETGDQGLTGDFRTIHADQLLPQLAASPGKEKAPPRRIRPDHLAYVIYTSGSTGRPKGVAVAHDSLLNYLQCCAGMYRTGDSPFHFPLFTSLSFDLTQTSILLPLITGGTVFVQQEGTPDRILSGIAANPAVNAVKLTPSHVHFLQGLASNRLKIAIVGGEELEAFHVKVLRKFNPEIKIFNEYGPTEATIGCTVWEVENGNESVIPIGRPMANTQIFIADEEGKIVPQGVSGEIWIGGRGLARGYLNQPAMTARKFAPHPFENNARIYKTGDLGRWLEGGVIEYKGRKDDQIKVRGFRVELGEVEAAVGRLDGVDQCTVVARNFGNGDVRLIAYVVGEGSANPRALAEKLSKNLPDYMVPAHWVALQALPLTSSGKVDKRQLTWDPDEGNAGQEDETPDSPTEAALTKIWKEMLSLNHIGPHDNFFNSGGHSLNAIPILFRINKALSINLNLMDLFSNPTIRALAAFIESERTGSQSVFPLNPVKPGAANLFCLPPILGMPVVFNHLARELQNKLNCYGLQYRGIHSSAPFDQSIVELAARLTSEILTVQPAGNFMLCGYSMGAPVAFEVAKQLEKNGHQVDLILIDRGPEKPGKTATPDKEDKMVEFYLAWLNEQMGNASSEEFQEQEVRQSFVNNIRILNQYAAAGKISGPVLAIESRQGRAQSIMKGWGGFTESRFDHAWTDAGHYELLDAGSARAIGRKILRHKRRTARRRLAGLFFDQFRFKTSS